MTPAAFLDYTPVSLAFGTSGLRGLVKDITDLEAYINVKGGLAYLLATSMPPAPGAHVTLVKASGDNNPSALRARTRLSCRGALPSALLRGSRCKAPGFAGGYLLLGPT